MTFSRSGIICFAAALFILARAIPKSQLTRPRRAALVMFLGSTAVLSIAWVGPDGLTDRFADADTLSLNGRLGIWRDTIKVIRDFGLVGTGLDTYAMAMAFHQPSNPYGTAIEAHSDYLQIAAEGGLLLLATAGILVGLFAVQARRCLRACAVASTDYWIRIGALTGLVAIGLQELGEFSLQMPGNAALFVVLCSIVVHRSTTEHNR
jgi:O-antigen ligase